MFKNIYGQTRAIDILKNAISSEQVAGSYLFFGPAGVGKLTCALYFGMALNCHAEPSYRPCGTCPSCHKFLQYTHPDMLYIFPTPNYEISSEGEIKKADQLAEYQAYIKNKMEAPYRPFMFSKKALIRIDMIRMLQKRIRYSLNEAKYKVYLVEDADKMNVQAANAFLKTLEEPPADTVIIMTTTLPNALLPTILSRCQKIQFSAVSSPLICDHLAELSIPQAQARAIAKLAGGNLKKAILLAKEGELLAKEIADQIFMVALAGDDIAFLAILNEYALAKHRYLLIEMLTYINIWVGDLAMLSTGSTDIVNLESMDVLLKILTVKPNIAIVIEAIAVYFDELKERMHGNVQVSLVITSVYNKLCELLN